jgi:hypothetical protein
MLQTLRLNSKNQKTQKNRKREHKKEKDKVYKTSKSLIFMQYPFSYIQRIFY